MGARFRLRPGFDIGTYSPAARVVLRAMQHYGMFLADNGSNFFFQGDVNANWPASLIAELKTVPANAFLRSTSRGARWRRTPRSSRTARPARRPSGVDAVDPSGARRRSAHAAGMHDLVGDPDVLRFTRVPDPPPADFVEPGCGVTRQDVATGRREAFTIEDPSDGRFLGIAVAPSIKREERTAELGYVIHPGRADADRDRRPLWLTDWGFREPRRRPARAADLDGQPGLETGRRAQRLPLRRHVPIDVRRARPVGRRRDLVAPGDRPRLGTSPAGRRMEEWRRAALALSRAPSPVTAA